MNFPSPTQSLQARAQPGGITPELIRLLAQMKVKQETDAAARDMAMKMGQQPPTVAEGLNEELEGNARQQITQKLGGLQAIAQQQAPQGAPTMPAPPAQPTQHMAAGGLARVKSNLPTRYAGGGIVAFGAGGFSSGNDEAPDYEALAAQREYNAQLEKYYAGERRTPPMPPGGAPPAQATEEFDPAIAAAYARPQETAANVALQRAAKKPAVAPRADVSANVRQAPVVAQPTAPAAPATGLGALVEKQMADRLKADGSKVEPTARADFTTRYQTELGPEEAALRAARLQDYEQAKAAQMARDNSGAPSIWDRLGTLGKHAGYGQWGQAAGDQRTMELAHEAQKAEGAKGLLALKQASDAMSLADKKALFGAAESKGTAAAAADALARKDTLDQAARLVGTQGTNAAQLQGIGMSNETQLKVANIQAASHKAAAKIAADRQDQVDKRNDITGLKSEIAAAEKSLAKYTPQALMLLTPGTPEHAEAIQEMAWAKAVREANRARLAELTGVEYKTAPGAAAAAPSNLVKVIGVKP
jgi:hypothetical protein